MKQRLLSVAAIVGLICGLFLVLSPNHQRGIVHLPKPLHLPGIAAAPATASSPSSTSSGHPTSADKAAQPVHFASTPHPAEPIHPSDTYVTIDDHQYPLRTYKTQMLPNDLQASQWWVSNAHLDSSWDIPAGSRQTTLAIIDTGIDLKHEEFAGRWSVNSGETGATTQEAPSALNCSDRGLPLSATCNLIDDNRDGIVDNETGATTYQNPSRLNCTAQARSLDKACNRIDDDSNGYVDDQSGWDFTHNDDSPQAGELNPTGTGTVHGTWVAGIAAASGNNGKGIAGVDWNTKILPLQALDDDSSGDTLSVGRAIYYAISRGVDIISISLGSDQPDDYVRQAVDAALKQGIVVVSAAGNDGCECMVYPANYPETLAVGALNNSNQLASFSSYGQNLDILAPGTNLTSSNYQSTNLISSYAGGLNGTSFATPMVAGMLTRLKSWQPTATPEQLIAALTENINRQGLPATTPHDSHYGFGSLDAGKAATRMTTAKSSFSYAFSPVSRGAYLDAVHPAEPGGNAFVYTCDNGTIGGTPIMENTKPGSTFYTISQAENHAASMSGYTSSTFFYGCVREPQDAGTAMRNLNIFKEFRDDYQH